MKPEITELYKIRDEDQEQVYQMMIRSFRNYEKLVGTFPDWEDRQAAIEMVIRYYGPFDFKYGTVYSLDENMNEALMVMYSEEEVFTEACFEAAGSNNEKFRAAAARLGEENLQRWWRFFEELDRKEAELSTIPDQYLYVDFLCVSDRMQGQGRGSRIIRSVCRYADEIGMPVMLFTNGEDDIRFYMKNGFRVVGVTTSEEFGFENTYVMYFPEGCGPETEDADAK